MADPLGKTMYHLAHTRNQAAVSVLASALASTRLEVRLGAIHALVVRRNPDGHSQILARFPTFNDRELGELANSVIRSPHRMQAALRDVLLADDQTLCDSACRMILMGRVYQLLPTLVEVTENRAHRHSAQASATLVQLASFLHQETLARPQDKTCEPSLVCRQVLPALEQSVVRYVEHRRLEIIDAFLLLVPPINDTFLRILKDPSHPCHGPVLNSLASSAVVPILELLAQLLHDTSIPPAALKIIAERLDRKFLDYLLHNIGSPISLRVLDNLRKLRSVTWLSEGRNALLEVDGHAQSVAIEVAKAGCVDRATYLSLLKCLLQNGRPEGRRASCEALADFHDRHVDQLVLKTLDDADPRVQAAAVRQLRERHIQDAMERLVALLDHPAAEVRDAARSSLAEFNFSRFRSAFELMDDATRRKVGRLVAKVDPTSMSRLAENLISPSISTKLRALEMAKAMDAVDAVFDRVAPLIYDPDVAVRTDAVAALGTCRRAEAVDLLYEAEMDASQGVRETASRCIEQIADRTAAKAERDALHPGDFIG
ncbi:MAG: HEAT repeat domain-containing protein [Pirellulales bacterium]